MMFGAFNNGKHNDPRVAEIDREHIAAKQMVESKFMALTAAMNLRDEVRVEEAMKELCLYYEQYINTYVDGYFEKVDITENSFNERKPRNET